jgi:hypothetical protein
MLNSLTWRIPLPQHGIRIELTPMDMPPLMELPTATTIYDKAIQHARQYVFLLGAQNIYPGTTFCIPTIAETEVSLRIPSHHNNL